MCLRPNSFPLASRRRKSPELRPAGDDHDVLDPRVHQRLDRVIDHRPVVDRQQMLVGDFREREQAAARAARQDDAFHKRSMIATRVQIKEWSPVSCKMIRN